MRRFCMLICLCLPFLLNGQRLDMRTWSVEDGLSQVQVSHIFQDSKGRLWIGTISGGLNLFDGRHFQQFTQDNGFPNNGINNIFEDPEGTVWVSSRPNGIWVYDQEELRPFLPDSLRHEGNPPNMLTYDKGRKVVWMSVLESGKLASYAHGMLQIYDTTDGLPDVPIHPHYLSEDSLMAFNSREGAFRFVNGKFEAVPEGLLKKDWQHRGQIRRGYDGKT
ncbi:MAG: two-component regulator propeller domain-containing protein, partial [Bacteroidota bacterium]